MPNLMFTPGTRVRLRADPLLRVQQHLWRHAMRGDAGFIERQADSFAPWLRVRIDGCPQLHRVVPEELEVVSDE